MKIRAYLSLLAAAVAVPVAVVSLWSLAMLGASGRESAMQAMHETVRAVSMSVDRELAASESRLHILAISDELEEGRLADLHSNMLRAIHQAGDSQMLLVDENGRAVVNTAARWGARLPPVATREQMAQLFARNQEYFSDLVVGPLTGKPSVAVFMPVALKNGRRYALVESISPALFERVLREEKVESEATLGLIDRSGKFIARNLRHDSMMGKPAREELMAAAAQNPRGAVRHKTWEGLDSWDTYAHTRRGNYLVALAVPVHDIEGAGHRAIAMAALGFATALLLASFFAWLFGRRLVSAIDHVARDSARLARGEAPQMMETGVHEMQRLQLALRRAAGLIREERSSRQAAEQERQRLLEVEQRARLSAEEENKSKDAFLAMLGHELRNPLSAISAGITVIQAAGAHTEVAARANEIIARQSAHLERIVDDLLDAARMLAGKITLVKQRVNLEEALSACIEALRAAGRLEHYQLDISSQPLRVDADPARIDQIINNLLNNALKYTPAGGHIRVTLAVEGGYAVLTVRDDGIGMRPELLEHVFDPFVQGKVSLDRAQGGLGVGLTLVKKLVELHGGSVMADSAGEGAGSQFTVRLPLAVQAPPAPGEDGLTTVPEAAALLFVEDNADAREMTAELLRLSGYRVTAVANGMDALRVARADSFVAAVIDIGLPDISGYELARQLRQWPQSRGIGLIALTGYGLESDIRQAREAGFDHHLVKPVNHQRLVQAIESARSSRSHTA